MIEAMLIIALFAFGVGWSCCECRRQERELSEFDHDIFLQTPPPPPEEETIRHAADGRRFRYDWLFERWEEIR